MDDTNGGASVDLRLNMDADLGNQQQDCSWGGKPRPTYLNWQGPSRLNGTIDRIGGDVPVKGKSGGNRSSSWLQVSLAGNET